MLKTGSKFLLGLSAFGFVGAFIYACTTTTHSFGMSSIVGALTLGYKGQVGDHVGYAILIGLSAATLFLGLFVAGARDCDPEAEAEVAGLETVPEVMVPSTGNYWPLVAAFSVASLALGLAFGSALFTIGMAGLAVCTIEWAARAWSDRATGDPAVNKAIRDRLLHPIETPLAALLIVAFIVVAVSRILLAVPTSGAYVVFGVVPVLILAVGSLIVLRPKLSTNVIAGIIVVAALALLIGGTAAAIHGERKEPVESGQSGLAPVPSSVIRVGN